MRFIYLELENYIGIYNGMQLSSIKIDLSRCMYRTLIIRGENGSGKSTIFKALSVFPDSNDSFIPGMPAKKIIAILDHDVAYTITFIHGIKNNGDRDTTKAFIKKNVGGIDVELNENGNVTSFKDIIFSELSLDPNFVALSQLSSEDKGLATKRPAERKKFVNSLIESLEVYNGIYKAITKKSTNIKSLIDNLVAKIGSIGDLAGLRARLSELDDLIGEVTESKKKREQIVMDNRASIRVLDPDNSIQNEYNSIMGDMSKEEYVYKTYVAAHTKPIFSAKEELAIVDSQIASYKTTLEAARSGKTVLEESITQTTGYVADISSQINDKKTRLLSLQDTNMADVVDTYNRYLDMIDTYKAEIEASGIDPDLFTKDEYITALETLKDIKHYIDLFRSDYTTTVIDEAVAAYSMRNWPSIAPLVDTTPENNIIDRFESLKDEYIRHLNSLAMDMEAIKKLGDRPATCTDNTCRFISDLIEISNRNPAKEYEDLEREYNEEKQKATNARMALDYKNDLNNALNQIRIIMRSIDNNRGILTRLPNGGIFSSKEEFFTRLLAGDDFSYMEKIYSYIDLANTVELYHRACDILAELKNKLDLYSSKLDIVRDLENDICNLEKMQVKYTDSLKEMKVKLKGLEEDIVNYMNANASLVEVKRNLEAIVESMDKIISYRKRLSQISDAMNSIKSHEAAIRKAQNEIIYFDSLLAEYNKSRSSVEFSIKQAESYEQELAVLKEQYDRIEIIKHYSSPTKGIQLVFMELYMGKILSLANELLSFLFNGEYTIQPFIINEDEFRIPCLGQGILNDDISSMSSSQLTMISMIISFALLHTSSTKYNILKLDEIDGPLDENNRIMFIDVINRIMDLMNVEQCIMVSHSAELQVDNSDVILLKSSQLSTDYNRGNIIWKY